MYSALVLLHLLKTLNMTHSCWTAWDDEDVHSVLQTKFASRNRLWINPQILNIWNYDERVNGLLNRPYTAVRDFLPYQVSTVSLRFDFLHNLIHYLH